MSSLSIYKSQQTGVCHARVKGDIFGVYHGDPKLLLNMPSAKEAPSPSPSSMQGNFWSPFPLLGRLYYGHVIPVEEVTPGRWGLLPRIREDWYTLELNLRAVLFATMERSRLQRPQCMVPFGYPYCFGYLGLYRTRNAARYIARRSIHRFLPLLSNLSMFFFYLRLAEMTIGLEGWRDEVCKVAQVHPQWLADLEHSAAGDLTIPRCRSSEFSAGGQKYRVGRPGTGCKGGSENGRKVPRMS
ncbi:hypothetical protein B0H10DRAFT_1942000 [Mycena sp. CBHHK59/15]|nr:hypothetical protein B0H10DRAFT_1942000 [Mycena sp. CBHHK59/15]